MKRIVLAAFAFSMLAATSLPPGRAGECAGRAAVELQQGRLAEANQQGRQEAHYPEARQEEGRHQAQPLAQWPEIFELEAPPGDPRLWPLRPAAVRARARSGSASATTMCWFSIISGIIFGAIARAVSLVSAMLEFERRRPETAAFSFALWKPVYGRYSGVVGFRRRDYMVGEKSSPMRFPPAFLDEIRDRVPISSVIGQRVAWDRKKTNAPRGDYWACCPFHGEKSPSFHCEDKKGRYPLLRLFGVGRSFQVPDRTRRDELSRSGREDRRDGRRADAGSRRTGGNSASKERASLTDVMEMATAFFQERLQGPEGAKARAYLRDRGLTPATQQSFRLGFAPDSRNALKEHLAAKGVPKADIEACGLVRHGDDIPVSYDWFPRPNHVPDPGFARQDHRLRWPRAGARCARQIHELAPTPSSSTRAMCSTISPAPAKPWQKAAR